MMNPLLIRTLRQEVRNRAFLGIYLALLAAGALTSAVVAASNDGERPGQILFVILSLASTGALWFTSPSRPTGPWPGNGRTTPGT